MKKSAVLAAMAAAIFFATAQAHATDIFSTGFEPAAYSPGALLGQNGWAGLANSTVQTGTVNAGTQAVAITGNATGTVLSRHSIAYDSVGYPENIVTINIDILMDNVADPDVRWEGLGLLGNAGFIAQTVIYQGEACAVSCSGVPFNPNTWNNLSLQLDFSTHMVSSFANGVRFSFDPFYSGWTSLSTVAFGVNAGNGSGTSTAYFDNLSVVSSVAEPPSFALVGGALLLLCAITAGRKRNAPRHSA